MNAPNFAQVLADFKTVDAENADRAAIDALQKRPISTRGSERWLDVRDEEEACDREDQRREALGLGDEE